MLMTAALCAAPQLKREAEVVIKGELMAKILDFSSDIPPATPQARILRVVSEDGDEKKYKVYRPIDLWRQRAEGGTWKDRRGNVMMLARVLSLVPDVPVQECTKENIEATLDEMEKSFAGSEDDLAKWKESWKAEGVGQFVSMKGSRRYWVEFRFAEDVKDSDAQKLLKSFVQSVSSAKGLVGSSKSAKWFKDEDGKFCFLTNLDKKERTKFLKDARRLMKGLRNTFEFYVPPKGNTPVCKVRVYKTLAEYREYRKSTGDNDTKSSGLWDPNREELLVVAEDRKDAQSTMQHESFHQYLHYATGRGDHAMWYNEGHATLFENIKLNAVNNTVRILDQGSRADWVAARPEYYAKLMPSVLKMSHSEFVSGDIRDINDHYVTSWAICYFLERGSYTAKEFAPYRGICARYLELMDKGESAEDATKHAWELAAGRDVSADFLKFWKKKRKAALVAREKEMHK